MGALFYAPIAFVIGIVAEENPLPPPACSEAKCCRNLRNIFSVIIFLPSLYNSDSAEPCFRSGCTVRHVDTAVVGSAGRGDVVGIEVFG